MANILELSGQEAYDYMMASDNYFTTELPEYIDFSAVLKCAAEKTKDIDILDINAKAAEQEDVNLLRAVKQGWRLWCASAYYGQSIPLRHDGSRYLL